MGVRIVYRVGVMGNLQHPYQYMLAIAPSAAFLSFLSFFLSFFFFLFDRYTKPPKQKSKS